MSRTIYTGEKLASKDPLLKQSYSAVEWLEKRHHWAKNNIPVDESVFVFDWNDDEPHETYALNDDQNLEIKKIKQRNNNFIYATAFGKIEDPQTPDRAPRAVGQNGGILRRFIGLDYDLETLDEAKKLMANAFKLFKEDREVNFAVYPSIRFPWLPRYRVVVDTKQWLDKDTYGLAVEHIMNLLEVPAYDDNTSIAHALNSPLYLHESSKDYAVFQTGKPPLDLNDIGFDPNKIRQSRITKNNPQTKEGDNSLVAPYREEQIKHAVDTYLDTDGVREELEEYEYFWRFAESLAYAYMQGLVKEDFVTYTLEQVAMGDSKWEADNLNVYQAQLSKLETQPEKRPLVKPLSSFLPIANEVQVNNPDVRNLSQLLASLLPPDFIPNGKYSVQDTADTISQFFDFGLLPGIEDDADALAVFDPLNGLWVHSDNDFVAMLNVIKPAITPNQVRTALQYWAAQANRNDAYIKPYSGSRYIVFKNGALDVKTMELLPLGGNKVKEQQFTKRNQLAIDYKENPELIDFDHDSLTGGTWNIEQFIRAYAHNDEEIRTYFLFGMALGIFSGHNTGVHFDIQGESGSGKSTLAYIYRGLFGTSRVAEILFSDLNKEFPLTSYDTDTSIIWIKESNTGVSPLDDDHGTPFYDGLADGYARIPVKHAGDILVANPPQVYIDGTQLIQSNDIRTGPARRTLAYKLPNPIEPYREQFYSNNIHERLLDERNLQYMVWEMLKAYKEVVPESRLDNFKLNLGVQYDLDMLPDIAKVWRQDFVSADSNMRQWYDDMVDGNILLNQGDAWLTDHFFYELYLNWYQSRNPQDPNARFARRITNFTDILYQIFEEENFKLVTYADTEMRNRTRISNPNKWGFQWTEFDELYMRPDKLRRPDAWPEVYKKRVKDVYRIVTEEPSERFYEKETELWFKPKRPTTQIEKTIEKESKK